MNASRLVYNGGIAQYLISIVMAGYGISQNNEALAGGGFILFMSTILLVALASGVGHMVSPTLMSRNLDFGYFLMALACLAPAVSVMLHTSWIAHSLISSVILFGVSYWCVNLD